MTETETPIAAARPAEPPVVEPRRPSFRRAISDRALAVAIVGAEMLALGIFGVRHARILITREDEVLALFVGRSGLGSALHQVLRERGGAPLHFMSAWTVVHLGGHLVALRIVSTLFVVGALPLIALLAARIARDGRVGVLAATLAAPTWLVLFNADFGRMYAQFLFFGTLAPLLLLRAHDSQRLRDWVFWWLACLGVLASHPYGAFVLAAGIAAVLVPGWRSLRTWWICAVPVLLAVPFWIADLVLRDRFSVGVGGQGESLGSLHAVAQFLRTSFRDASSWHGPALWLAAALAIGGAVVVCARNGRVERTLVVASFVLPVVALLGARADTHVSPETRHLIFLLPFVQLFVAVGIVRIASLAGRAAPLVALGAVALLVSGSLHSSKERTPDLFRGEPGPRGSDRAHAAQWLDANTPRGTLLMGYEPLFYEAWARRSSFSSYVVARADSAVAAKQLQRYCGHFTSAAFVFDRQNGYKEDLTPAEARALTRRLAAAGFAVRRFGDFVVALSDSVGEPSAYIDDVTPLLRVAEAAKVDNGRLELTTLENAKRLLPPEPC